MDHHQDQLFSHESPPFRRGSLTSRQAAASVADKAPTKRDRVLSVLRLGPLTDEQIAARLGMRDNSVRPRRIELARDGLIVEAGTALTTSGRAATLWKVA